jgi:hypothetical protein
MYKDIRSLVVAKSRSLTKWKKARANGFARLLIIGDSTTVGVGSMGTLHTNNRAGSNCTHLKNLLNAQGVSARCDWWIGDGNSGSNLTIAEPRIALGSGWVIDTLEGLAGFYLLNSTTTTGALEWTTTVPCDRVEIGHLKGSGPRSFEVFCDDVSMGVTDISNASTVWGTTTVNLPTLAAHKIGIKRVAGGCRINWIRPYCSTGGEIMIGNAGRGSVTAVTLSNAATSGTIPIALPSTITNAVPDLTIINIGYNDQTATVTATAYKAAMQVLINAAKVTGDVILVIPPPRDETTPPTIPTVIYQNVIKELGAENKCPVIDTFSMFGSYAQTNARSLYMDGTHMLSIGYQEQARMFVGPVLR